MSEIKPALSPEEWATLSANGDDGPFALHRADPPFAPETLCLDQSEGPSVMVWKPGSRHALAALALHGQPYGFTWGDVEMLRDLADSSEWVLQELRPWAANLADRIAALLPPREP